MSHPKTRAPAKAPAKPLPSPTPRRRISRRKPQNAAIATVPDGEATPIVKGSHVYLVDGSGYIFRAFHALPPLTRPSDGLPVGAVHGFCAMLWKLLRESKASEAPTHIAVIFDAGRENFRNEIYEDYKANRPPPPDELVPQFPLIRDAVKAFNVACVEQEGYEADDLIATYAREIVDAGGDVTIVSSDKDLMQLVRPGVVMFDAMKSKKLGREEVMEKFGVAPDKVVDVQALAGDSTDNVPGVPGIGVKTAAELINEYGDLDTLLQHASEIKQPKRREKLIEFADQARLSRELVRLKNDVDTGVPVDALGVHDPRAGGVAGLPARHGVQHADAAHRGSARRRTAAGARGLGRRQPPQEGRQTSSHDQGREDSAGRHRDARCRRALRDSCGEAALRSLEVRDGDDA